MHKREHKRERGEIADQRPDVQLEPMGPEEDSFGLDGRLAKRPRAMERHHEGWRNLAWDQCKHLRSNQFRSIKFISGPRTHGWQPSADDYVFDPDIALGERSVCTHYLMWRARNRLPEIHPEMWIHEGHLYFFEPDIIDSPEASESDPNSPDSSESDLDIESPTSSQVHFEASSSSEDEDTKEESDRKEDEIRAPRQALMVVLAMSYERETDVRRILALLERYEFVIAVSIIKPPSKLADYGRLLPYVQNGRFEYVEQDFKTMRDSGARRPGLLQSIGKHMDLPQRIVCLDYFFLIHTYYASNYGMNWLYDAGHKREGKARQILAYATDVYLPVDKSANADNPTGMLAMLDQYAKTITYPTMSIEKVQSSPLLESDASLGEIPNPERKGTYVSAEFMVEKWLNEAYPFIHIRLI